MVKFGGFDGAGTRATKRRPGQRIRRAAAVTAAVGLLLGAGACAQSKRDQPGSTENQADQTFTFAASADPIMMDPAFASEGETFRVTRQIYEGLVSTKPGTTDLAPSLAEKWEASEDGKSYTFQLRSGVKFSDNTAFNAEAVCANFDRWYNFTGLNQSENLTYYYGKLFRGFKTGKTGGIYDSCSPKSENEVTIKLKSPFAGFVQAMTLPSFSMQSPTAMKQYDADNTKGTEQDPRFSSYATQHPTGTGPFIFEKWDRGQQVTLKRNDNYWGDKAKISKVIIRTISDPKARTQELEAGTIDGYDLVGPADVQSLKDKGYQIQNRPAFNILYLGMNQKTKALQDIKVRQAISYAIDKQTLLKSVLPPGSVAAKEFMPNLVSGYNENVTDYAFNLDKAKQLLKESGHEGMTLRFAYPTGVSRPYMPTPEDTYAAIRPMLEAAGFKVQPITKKWSPDYLDFVQGDKGTGDRDIHFLGWTGDYNDADNFLGVFFGAKSNEWGFDNDKLFADLKKAREIPTREEQKTAYESINKEISDYVPGVPLAHPAPSLAFGKGVQGYTASPVQDEVWNTVTVQR